jgi:hypothetical protein
MHAPGNHPTPVENNEAGQAMQSRSDMGSFGFGISPSGIEGYKLFMGSLGEFTNSE